MMRSSEMIGGVVSSVVMMAALTVSGCVDRANSWGPPDNGDLIVVAAASPGSLREGESVALSAIAAGGSAPYVFRWSFNGGPDVLEPSDVLGASVNVGPFVTAGRYVYRVVATDAQGRTAVDFVAVVVSPGVQITLSSDVDTVFEGSSVELSTEVTDGATPLSFVWSLVDGPVDVDLSGETADSLRTPPLSKSGAYLFDVTVKDADGFTGTATRTITVDPLFSIDAPAFALVNAPVSLGVTFETDVSVDSFAWSIAQGGGTIDAPNSETPNLTATAGETLRVALAVGFENASGQTADVSHEVEVVTAETTRPRVLIATNFGDIVMELNADAAPRTTANFLAYVDEGFFDGVLFHRNACTDDPDTGACVPFVLQGGGFVREGDELVLKDPTRDPVVSEADNGLSNAALFSVAMALSGGNADSAQTQFFINLDDNAFLDNQNFTVFATIVSGTDVVNAIAAMERTDSTIIPGEVSLPVEDVIMERVTRVVP